MGKRGLLARQGNNAGQRQPGVGGSALRGRRKPISASFTYVALASPKAWLWAARSCYNRFEFVKNSEKITS